jgi:hypothetical protein
VLAVWVLGEGCGGGEGASARAGPATYHAALCTLHEPGTVSLHRCPPASHPLTAEVGAEPERASSHQ